MEHVLVAKHEKPRGGMLCVQVHQAECSCGWKSEWAMPVDSPEIEFAKHLEESK